MEQRTFSIVLNGRLVARRTRQSCGMLWGDSAGRMQKHFGTQWLRGGRSLGLPPQTNPDVPRRFA
jgi:hypothetical protein